MLGWLRKTKRKSQCKWFCYCINGAHEFRTLIGARWREGLESLVCEKPTEWTLVPGASYMQMWSDNWCFYCLFTRWWDNAIGTILPIVLSDGFCGRLAQPLAVGRFFVLCVLAITCHFFSLNEMTCNECCWNTFAIQRNAIIQHTCDKHYYF